MGLESSLYGTGAASGARSALADFLRSAASPARQRINPAAADNAKTYQPPPPPKPQQVPMVPLPAGNSSTEVGPSMPHTSFDYSYDPVLLGIEAAGGADAQTAEATATAEKRNALAAFGDPGIAQKVLGLADGDPFLQTISGDPDKSTSTLARILRAYRGTVHDTEDQLNENNLFYSGYRGKKLADLAQDKETQIGDANAALQDELAKIGQDLLGAKQTIAGRAQSAEGDAFNRALLAAIANAGGYSDTSTTSPTETPAPAPDTNTTKMSDDQAALIQRVADSLTRKRGIAA